MLALECEIWMACFITIQRKDEVRVSNLFEMDGEDNCKSGFHTAIGPRSKGKKDIRAEMERLRV
jgi:hypothetical protein